MGTAGAAGPAVSGWGVGDIAELDPVVAGMLTAGGVAVGAETVEPGPAVEDVPAPRVRRTRKTVDK